MPNLPKARFYKVSKAIFVWRMFTSAIQRALASEYFVVSAFLWNLAHMSLLSGPAAVARVQCRLDHLLISSFS